MADLITDYGSLRDAIAGWLNRGDLSSRIPQFIQIAEATMSRRLRRATKETSFTIDAAEKAIPADCKELESIVLSSGLPYLDKPMRVGTPTMLADRRVRSGNAPGRPDTVAVIAGNWSFAPPPDASYTATVTYVTKLIPITESSPMSALLTEAPDIYLFGALLEAVPYLKDDDRVPLWKAKFDAAIDELNDVRVREEFSAAPRDVRLPRVFG